MDGMRTIALKLEFGASHNQIFERHFSFYIILAYLYLDCVLFAVFSFSKLPFIDYKLSEYIRIYGLICRTLAVHFTDPFHVSTRVADKCNDGTLLLQVFVI